MTAPRRNKGYSDAKSLATLGTRDEVSSWRSFIWVISERWIGLKMPCMHTNAQGTSMGRAVIKTCDQRAVHDAYFEQIEFGCAPKSAINLATIVYLQRHPTVTTESARARVDQILQDYVC